MPQWNQNRGGGHGVVAHITKGGGENALGETVIGKNLGGAEECRRKADIEDAENHTWYQNHIGGNDSFQVKGQNEKADEGEKKDPHKGGEHITLGKEGATAGEHGEESAKEVKKEKPLHSAGEPARHRLQVVVTGIQVAKIGSTKNQVADQNQQKGGKDNTAVVGARWDVEVFHNLPSRCKACANHQTDIDKCK